MINADMGELRMASLEIKICRKIFSSFSELAAFCWSLPPPRSVAGYQTAVICNKTTDLEQQPQQRGKEKAEHSNRGQRLNINIEAVKMALYSPLSCNILHYLAPSCTWKEKAEHSNRDQPLNIIIEAVTNQSIPLSLCSSTSEANK